MTVTKKISLILLIIGYIAAGINHFRVPEFYIAIIPHYIPYPQFMNAAAGIFEILFGLGLAFKITRKLAAWGIVLMLLAFLPVHITMITDAPFKVGNTTVTLLLAWLRLALQPVLIAWAWWHTKDNKVL
ncbi:DoxX family protein [Mucilaginibacter calamicampi]|uniref:DoxX family protein n=1 Tax=Mucilaginibacter calamicampi TaxID=1302352 RepID=A0ABW2Z2Y7_9SPHI